MSGDAAIVTGFVQRPDVVLRPGAKTQYSFGSYRTWVVAVDERPTINLTNSQVRTLARKAIFIAELGDERLCLKSPLPIHLEQAGAQVLAYSYDLAELEVGDDEWSVIAKMKAAIVDLFFMLKAEQENLGPVPQTHWSFLKKVIAEV